MSEGSLGIGGGGVLRGWLSAMPGLEELFRGELARLLERQCRETRRAQLVRPKVGCLELGCSKASLTEQRSREAARQ